MTVILTFTRYSAFARGVDSFFCRDARRGLGREPRSPFEQASEEGSLAQAFLIAGAQTVVATLWRVDDAGSVDLARSFYQQVRSGATPDEALATAQRGAIRAPGYSWAAYTVSGKSKGHR